MHDTSIFFDRARRLASGSWRWRACVRTIARSLALLAGLAPVASAATYYVDAAHPSAIDAGPGTSDTPYRTIQAAVVARASAGNTIVVKPATYRETVTISASGSAASRIALNVSGPGVVISGTDDFSSTSRWSAVSGDVYLAASVTWPPAQVFADGARLTPSILPPTELPARSFRHVLGVGLYVNAGGGNPALHGCEVGRRSTGIFVTGAYVTVSGFAVTRTEDRAIGVVAGGVNAWIENCTVSFANKYAIDVRNTSGAVISGNRLSDNGDHGIFVFNASGTTIRDNESFRNARPTSRAANGIALDSSPGCTIERNRCHDNQDSGLQFYNGSHDVLSRNNLSWNNGDHGFDHVRVTGSRHYHDVAWGNYKDGFSFEGSSSGCSLYDCIGVNNGLTTGEFNLWVDLGSAPGFTADYNLFWNSTSRNPVKFVDTQYALLSTYSAISGQDHHSRQLDPRFVDASNGNFRLQPGSPAIDAAVAAQQPAWPAADRDGVGRIDDPGTPNSGAGTLAFADIGAYEFVPVPAPPSSNLCGNPGFESNSDGWDPFGSSTLERVSGGHSGSYCAEVHTSGSSTFGMRDDPNWVATTLAAGTIYRFSAWVRSASSRGSARLRVREYVGSSQQGSTQNSPSITLSSSWRQLTVDFETERTQSTLEFEIRDSPSSSRETFQIDDVSIVVVTPVETDDPPGVTAPAAVIVNEGQPVVVNVVASDPEGDAITALTANLSALPAGHGAVFTPNGSNTGGTLTWTPTVNDGRTSPYAVTFTATNEQTATATTAITVTDGASGANLCGNPDFETGIVGWEPYGVATLSRVAGGRSGSFCAEIRGSGSATIGMGDFPNWVDPVPAPGTRYRYSAWVRSASHRGTGKLQVREFLNGSLQGSAVLSPGVTLSPTWQQVTAEITTLRTGSVIETEVKNYPATSGEVFQVDDFTITRIGTEPELADRISGAERLAENRERALEFGATVPGNPVRGSAMLEFALTRAGKVRVQVFDVRGRQMASPFEGAFGAGRHRLALGGGQASRLAPGAYFYRLSAAEGVRIGKFVVLE